MTHATRLYVKVSDAPVTFAVSTDTIYRAAKRGELTIYKPVGVALLKVAEVEAWIAGRTQ